MNDEAGREARPDTSSDHLPETVTAATTESGRPGPVERLANPSAFLSRTDLRTLGLERRAIDAVFRGCPIVAIPGYSRPLIRVADYIAYLDDHTYAGDRVRP